MMLNNYRTNNQARIFTAFILTGILSLGSGFTLIKNATAASTNLLPEARNEVLKQNFKSNRLPRPVANAVLQDLSRRQGIPRKELQITDYSQKTWRDGCLELTQPGELCTQALVPGWRVTIRGVNQSLVYHTNQTGSVVRLSQAGSSGITGGVPIPASELPPPLDQNTVFRQISSGGFAGRTYQTVLLNDGRLIRVRIGDANDSERSVRRISPQQVRQFKRFLERSKFRKFINLSYPAPSGAADFITYTLTSREGTVQYNDISLNNLPRDLREVVNTWNQLVSDAQR